MKKTIIILAAFAAVASACTREELPTGETNLTFIGTISQTAGTKAQLGEGEQDGTSTYYPAEFAIGDEIAVMPNSYWTSWDYSKVAKFVAVTAGATATFEMASGESLDKSDGPYTFYYPYDSWYVLPTQTHVPGNAAKGSVILKGDVSQTSFTEDIKVDFKPASTLLKIVQPTPNKPVNRIVLTDSNGLYIQLSCDNTTAYESYIMGVDPEYDFSDGTVIMIHFADGTRAMKSLAGKSVKDKEGHIITVMNFEPVEIAAVATDLSASATANSYIVSEAGKYKFKSVQGNSTTSVGTVVSTEVLWESFGTDAAPSVGDLVYDVSYEGGYITFTASALKGNAVIAARDASGTILWSWHIWMTDQPVDQVYNNDAGTMMDRNLGATSATPGDVRARGLMYQWGRKDPFRGRMATTIHWPSAEAASSHLSDNNTLAYAQANPTTFITSSSSPYDWYCISSSYKNDNLWSSTKSVYDPCPAGYRVPDGGTTGIWSTALGTSSSWETSSNWDSTNNGMNLVATDRTLGSASTIWYPGAGGLWNSSGAYYNVGLGGNYWSVSPSGFYVYSFSVTNRGGIYPANTQGRVFGKSVRCCKE